MTEERSPLDQLLDLVVYAPLGLIATAREELPALIDRGRQQAAGQVAVARMVGQLAVAQVQKEATQWLRQTVGRRPDGQGGAGAPPATPPPAAPVPTAGAGPPAAAAPSPDQLAIPGYDALSASQVVQRLAGLADDELEAVREYETAHRGRKTILGRITQLQSGA